MEDIYQPIQKSIEVTLLILFIEVCGNEKFMVYCDRNEKILEWGSEDSSVPYRSLDGKIHRYFPDFYVRVKTPTGTKKWIVEVKPKAQCKPPRLPKRKTKKYLNEVRTWAINDAKWKNAIGIVKTEIWNSSF